MIFITVGTTQFPMQRMVDVAAEIIRLRKDHERIVFQYGNSSCLLHAPNLLTSREFPFQQVQRYMKEARLIICHGGPATIYQALFWQKTPFVLPRERRFGEHVNDHQVAFVSLLSQKRLVVRVAPPTDIRSFLSSKPAKRKKKPSSAKAGIIVFLHNFLMASTPPTKWPSV